MSCSGCNTLRQGQAKSVHRVFSSSVQTAIKEDAPGGAPSRARVAGVDPVAQRVEIAHFSDQFGIRSSWWAT